MADERDFRQEPDAFTTPAENGTFQFCSRLDQRQPQRTETPPKKHGILGPLIAALLILIAAGTAFCVMILHVSLAVRHDSSGFSIQLVRRQPSEPLLRLENSGIPAPNSAFAEGSRYEWNGETLRMSASNRGDALSFAQLYSTCAPCIGILQVQDALGGVRTGSVIAMSEDGALIASTHLVSGAESLQVAIGGREYDAYIVGLDYATDITVLKIDAQGLATATFSSGEGANPGDSVAVIGNPVGGVINISDGILSAVNPAFDYRGFTLEAFQIALPMGDLASGSALVNGAGQVIGIVNMDMAAQLEEGGGISFAISMHTAKNVIDELLKNGFVAGRPSSGLTVSELPAAYAAYYEYPGLLYITAVKENSPAETAGLRRGDLILKANGRSVETVSDLYAVINGCAAGDLLTLEIYRDRETMEISFQLTEASRPSD